MKANPLRSASQSRRLLGPLLKSWYRISVVGGERVPTEGPVLVVSNHPGILDAGVVLTCLPRPVRVLDTDGVLAPVLDRALNLTGRIRMASSGPDIVAVHEAVAALGEGHAVAVFPEVLRADGTVCRVRHEMAYLALRADAVVVPVAIFGTAMPGMAADALPKRGTEIHMHIGVPHRLGRTDDPHRRRAVASAAEGIRQRLTDHVARVQSDIAVALPGDQRRQLVDAHRDVALEGRGRTAGWPGEAGPGGTAVNTSGADPRSGHRAEAEPHADSDLIEIDEDDL